MRRTRVLFFAGSFEQGGAERQLAELVKNLPRDRFEAHVAVCNARDDLLYDLPLTTFTDLGTPRGPDARTFAALLRVLRRVEPDVVHSVHDPQNTYARLATRLLRRRCAVVGSLRCTRLPRRTIRREWLTHRLGSALIVNSGTIREELERRRIGPVDVIANGVDRARFAPLGAAERQRARARFDMRGPTFVVPGRIAEQKNQLAVLRAVGRLRSEKAWPDDARVILAGRVESHTDYADHVDRAVSELRLGSIVRRIEPVSDVEALLAAADATLLPSLYEGLPNAVLESLACATPVVVSSAANRDALVRHGVSGVVTAADDWSIAAAMRSVLAMPGEARVAMGRAGREDVLARFGIARMVDATCAVYERVTA